MLDTVIIGSGPAGLGAAIYASRAALDYVVLEKAGYSGGQIVTTNDLDNYPGMPNIDGASFSIALQEHAEKLGAVIKEATVTAIERNDDKSFSFQFQQDLLYILVRTSHDPGKFFYCRMILAHMNAYDSKKLLPANFLHSPVSYSLKSIFKSA